MYQSHPNPRVSDLFIQAYRREDQRSGGVEFKVRSILPNGAENPVRRAGYSPAHISQT